MVMVTMKRMRVILILSWLYLGNVNCETVENNKSLDKRAQDQEHIIKPPVTIVEVRRLTTEDSQVKFTVRYKPEVNDFTTVWRDFRQGNGAPLEADVTSSQDLNDGTVETSVIVPRQEDPNSEYRDRVVRVEFTSNISQVMLELLNDDEEAVSRDISLPVVDVEPSGDLVYEEGEDIVFTMTGPLETRASGPNGMTSDLDGSFMLLDPTSGDILTHLGRGPLEEHVELVERNIFTDHEELTIKIETSEFKTSGTIVFSARFLAADTQLSLVQIVQVSDFVVLHPSSQETAFPPGYVGFVPHGSHYTDDDKQLCSYRDGTCYLECLANAENIQDLQLVRISQDGTKESLTNIPRFTYIEPFDAYFGSVMHVGATFTFKTTPGNTERFQCIATNTDGQTTTSDKIVEYVVPLEILREESGVEVTTNEAIGAREVTVVCKVRGRPRPEVTISVSTTHTEYYRQSPDQIFDDGHDEYRFVRLLSIDISDFHGNYRGRVTSASCWAKTDNGLPNNNEDYYFMLVRGN